MATGFSLNIDNDLLKNLEKADELVQDIGKHSEQTEKLFNTAFAKMTTGSLDGFIQKLMSARQAIQDIGDAKVSDKGLGSISTQAVQGADSVNNLVESITRLMQVAQGREKVQPIDINSIDIAEDNIESLREKIATLKRLLSQNRQGLIDETQQQNAKWLLDEINRLQVAYGNLRTEQKNLQSFDKFFSLSEDTISQTEKKLAKMRELWSSLNKDPQKYEEELKAVGDEIDRLAEKQNKLKKLTTFEGAMDFSKSTKSIKDQIQAIKYLKAARENLSKEGVSEADYRKKVKELTDEIKRQQKEVDKLVGKNSNLANAHKSLINTADQLKRVFALIFSVSAIRGYVTEIAHVRGEFELQQRSLQAILQNKDEADRLWQQTIQLAVRSPFQVKELVTYTKQLAAYRVESDKLYDTTKMLADVSAGLGVDMNRLILAYGQVKAANYLRGTELRQFSEAGVNILAELAKYFTELEGRAVSVGDVFERVSKRMVTFADVEEIFKRITSEGGVFYNMQEIQAETLKGQISNLRDSVDIMLNDIGKANEHILKGSVNAVKLFVENWQMLVPVLKAIVAGFALTRVNALLAKESIMLMAMDFGVLVNAEQKALTVTQLLNVGWKSFVKNIKAAGAAAKAFVASNPILAALTAILYVLVKVGSAWMEHKREIDEINKKYQDLGTTIKAISNKFSLAQEQGGVKDLRKELTQLIDLANREYNMDIKVDASKLNTSELAQKFIEIREKIFDAQEIAKTFELAMQKVASWKPDKIDIFGDLDKAEESVLEQYSVFRKAAADTVYELEQIQHKLTQSQIDALNKLRQPQQIDETQFQYVERLRDAYSVLMQNYMQAEDDFTGGAARRNRMLDEWSQKMKNVGIDAKKFSNILREWSALEFDAQKEFNTLFDSLESELQGMSDEDRTFYLKTAIDKQGFTDIQRELAYYFANQRWGINIVPTITPDPKDESPYGPDNDKQNKLTSKRISLIKEMRREYEQLNKTFDKTVSKEKVIASYTKAVNEAFKGTGISINDIEFDSLEALAESLEGLKDLAAKEGTEAKLALEKAISGVRVQIGVETKQGEDKKLKQQVEDLFSRYDITLDLEKLGLSKDLMSSLFDVEALDLSGLRKAIEGMQQKFIGTDMEKEYQQYLDKITDMETKAQQERLKTYLDYARNAIGERAKIKLEELRKLADIEKTFDEKSPEKELAKQNVKEEAYQKTQKLEWEEFQKSDTFISLFKDLDMASSTLINHAIEKLNNFKDEWKNMPLEDMRSIVDKINQLEGQLVKINPFAQGRELKAEVKKDGRSVEQIQQDNINEEAKLLGYEQEIAFLEEILRLKQDGNIQDEFAIAAANNNEDVLISTSEEIAEQIQSKKDLAKLTRQDISNNNKALANQQQLKRSYSEQADAISKAQQMANDLIDSFSELAEVLGADGDGIGMTFVNMGQDMMNTVLNTIMLQAQLNAAAVAAKGLGVAMNTAMGVVGWIVMAVQLLVSLFAAVFKAHDKGLQKQIDKLAVQTEDLQEKFEALEAAVDKAYSTDTLKQATKDAEKYTKQMIANYEAMIKLEKQKKKTDEEKIKEYEESIAAQREALEDLKQDMLESMGGVTDYRSATQDFVDAWVEAYKECGDGLNGLQDNFTEFFDNLIKQQATMKVTEKFLEPFYDNLNLYLDDYELTKDEMDKLREQAKNIAPELSKYLEELWHILGGSMGETGGSLSGLQAGIQGITESQAEIISAYLNSIRFFVSDNNSVMKQLRDYVIGTEENANPMLAQLRIIAQQTSAMRTLLDSVTQSGHPKGQSGIRVFID